MNAWRRGRVGSYLLAGLLAGLVPALLGCTTNPATGEQSFTAFMSPAEERRIGAEAHPKLMVALGGAYDEPGLSRYVETVGRLLQSTTEGPNERFTFTVVNSPVVNATALPGGYVYVSRGLIALANNEAELAGVIGHEIGHVIARHTAERYSQGLLAGLGAALVGAVAGDQRITSLVRLGAAAYVQGYSRGQELEADRLGVRYMTRAGFDPAAMVSFLRSMQAEDELARRLAGREGRDPSLGLFASHPRTEDRIVEAASAARAGANRPLDLDREIFLRRIDGMLYGDDPEQGFIRGRVFAHPVLRFRFEAPPGFDLVNGPNAVVGRHPRGAMLVFDGDGPPSRAMSMASYLRDVWAPRLELTRIETIDVNGMEAATGAARIGTGGGPRDARFVAIRFDRGRIYRFLILTPPELTVALDEDLRRATYSFRRLSADEAARLRPLRVRVVEVGPNDSVETLARRMAFDRLQVERFRVLNGLRPGEPVSPGGLVKIVVE